MKYCPKCGNINGDKAKFCYSCGHPFPEETIKEDSNTETVVEQEKGSPYYKVENNKTFIEPVINTKATLDKVSMILGIISLALLGMCCFPISIVVAPIAIITGIVSLCNKKNIDNKKAVLGIVFGGIALLLSIILFAILPSVIEVYKEYARNICNSSPNSDECQIFKKNFPGWFK